MTNGCEEEKRVKICICVHQFPARSETFVREHAVRLARRGHRVTVLARSIGDGIWNEEIAELDELKIERVYVGRNPNRRFNEVRAFLEILRRPSMRQYFKNPEPWSKSHMLVAIDTAREIARRTPDVVHVHFGTLAARIHAASFHVKSFPPMVVTWHGYDANAIPRRYGSGLYADLFASEARHTVGSAFMWDRLTAIGARENSMELIPMGIDLQRFSPLENPEKPPDDVFRVVSVGRLDEVKGHRYLIEACALLVKTSVPIDLRIIGEGPLRNQLEKQVSELGICEHVRLVGALPSDRVVRELQEAHVFALTGVEDSNGRVETQGVVFAEAQACGLPVVASRVGGVPGSIIHGRTGILCAPKDPAAVADALLYFALNKNVANNFGKEGREFVEEEFSVCTMISRFERLCIGGNCAHDHRYLGGDCLTSPTEVDTSGRYSEPRSKP